MWKAVLIVLLILCVSIVAFTFGGVRGAGDVDDATAWAHDAFGRFVSQKLPLSDVHVTAGPCVLAGATLTVNASRTCTLRIQDGSGRVRLGTMTVTRGVVTIKVTPGAGDTYSTARNKTLASPNGLDLDVRAQGATVAATCIGDQECRVHISGRSS